MKNVTLILHTKAKALAATLLLTEGELLTVLIEMQRERCFLELGFSGIWEYCVHELKLSHSQAFYYKSVAKVPELTKAVVEGKITLSQARRIVPVVTSENHQHWITQAVDLKQPELEKAVAAVNPNARVTEKIRPVAKDTNEIKASVDDATEKKLTELRDVLSQKRGRAVSLSEVLAWVTELAHEKHAPTRKAERAFLRKAKPAVAPKPGRHPIPAAVRHEVVKRKGWRCDRCPQTRHLHFHHLVAVADGGLNVASNLVLLCSAHHSLVHRVDSYSSSRSSSSAVGDAASAGAATATGSTSSRSLSAVSATA